MTTAANEPDPGVLDAQLFDAMERVERWRALSRELAAAEQEQQRCEAAVAALRAQARVEAKDVSGLERGLPGLVAFVKGNRDERLLTERAEAQAVADQLSVALGRVEDAQIATDRVRRDRTPFADSETALRSAIRTKQTYVEQLGDWRASQLRALTTRIGEDHRQLAAAEKALGLFAAALSALSDARRPMDALAVRLAMAEQQYAPLVDAFGPTVAQVREALVVARQSLEQAAPCLLRISVGATLRDVGILPPLRHTHEVFELQHQLKQQRAWAERAAAWASATGDAVRQRRPELQAALGASQAARLSLLRLPAHASSSRSDSWPVLPAAVAPADLEPAGPEPASDSAQNA